MSSDKWLDKSADHRFANWADLLQDRLHNVWKSIHASVPEEATSPEIHAEPEYGSGAIVHGFECYIADEPYEREVLLESGATIRGHSRHVINYFWNQHSGCLFLAEDLYRLGPDAIRFAVRERAQHLKGEEASLLEQSATATIPEVWPAEDDLGDSEPSPLHASSSDGHSGEPVMATTVDRQPSRGGKRRKPSQQPA